jgi:hypothetical protein
MKNIAANQWKIKGNEIAQGVLIFAKRLHSQNQYGG